MSDALSDDEIIISDIISDKKICPKCGKEGCIMKGVKLSCCEIAYIVSEYRRKKGKNASSLNDEDVLDILKEIKTKS